MNVDEAMSPPHDGWGSAWYRLANADTVSMDVRLSGSPYRNAGGNILDDRVLPHIGKDTPHDSVSPKSVAISPFLGKLLFGHIRPLHHIANLFPPYPRPRDEIRPVNQCFIQRGQRKISPDAVGYQSEMLALLLSSIVSFIWMFLTFRSRIRSLAIKRSICVRSCGAILSFSAPS